MRDWITPKVDKEFSEAYLSLRSLYTPGERFEHNQYTCSPEALSIKQTKGHIVQAIEVSILQYGLAAPSDANMAL
jgi:hypothetical protein